MPIARTPLAACVLVLLLLAACDRGASAGPEQDLAIARDAYAGGFFLEAETAYERYLQSDPQGRNRLEAWTRLVEICSGVKGDPGKAVTLLEAATLEFATRPKENWPLLFRLGELYEQQGGRKKALEAWTRCLDTAGGDAARTAQVQLRMAVAQRALGKSDLAVELLGQAVRSPDATLRAQARYELAQTNAMAWNWPKARTSLEELLAGQDTPQEVRVMGTLLLADACEAEHDLPRARQLLESLRDSYPNPEVIATRLASLGQRNESPAMARLQPGDGPPPDADAAGSAEVKRRRVRAR